MAPPGKYIPFVRFFGGSPTPGIPFRGLKPCHGFTPWDILPTPGIPFRGLKPCHGFTQSATPLPQGTLL